MSKHKLKMKDFEISIEDEGGFKHDMSGAVCLLTIKHGRGLHVYTKTVKDESLRADEGALFMIEMEMEYDDGRGF